MERRVLLAVALSILVLFGFRYLEERRMGGRPLVRPAAKQLPVPAQAPPPTVPAAAPLEQEPTIPSAGDTDAAVEPLVVEGDLYRAILDNRGAVISSWQLKKYRSGKGEIFEMIAGGAGADPRPYPGSLVLEDPGLTNTANHDPYQVEVVEGTRSGSTLSAPAAIVLRLTRGDLTVEKRYRFLKDNYLVDCSVAFARSGKPIPGRVLLGEDIGPEHEHLIGSTVQLTAVSNQAGKVRRDGPPEEEKEPKRVSAEIRWVGLDMQYFTILAVPRGPQDAFEIQKKVAKTFGLDGKEVSRNLVRVAIPVNGGLQYQLFVGPKEQSSLEMVRGAELQNVIDYGMFSVLVRPLLVSLKWLYGYVRNYGAAIVLLTLLLTLLLFPFRLKQMVSMKKMAVVQPKIKAIQEKYKRYKATDPKRAEMNQEVMAVYKEHHVNPLGGCLPLLLQMPILFAFYSLLAYSIELRQAPFAGWIHDLSVKDPYYILPIVMGITMMISQKMTPMTPGADPTQAKVMMVMPAVFTVMFLNVSSGLNLYFLCSNVFQIAFQKIAERWVSDKPAERKPKP